MKVLLVFCISLLLALPAFAADKDTSSHLLGTFGLWRAYQITEHNQPVCYMSLIARFPKNQKFRRGDANLTITHRPTENSKDVVSYTAGYNYKPMSDATLHIGKNSFSLFTSQDTAWSRDAATDHKIAAALQSAPSLTISGTPARKNAVVLTDKFSLKGAAEAYHSISKACGVEATPKPAAAAPPKAKKHR